MCGIAGIVQLDGSRVELQSLKQMTDALIHRGPEGEGFWISEEGSVGFGHRRLAIIDLSDKGFQPMRFGNRYTITYNGEIYNYLELREQLRALGYHFTTQTDTEVILAAYRHYSESCVKYFDGMFSFAIYDAQERSVFCARDRFGEKPFYYRHQPGRQFVFGSEMKALFAMGTPRTVNNRMLFYFLAYNIAKNPFDESETFFNGICELEAAHYLKISANGSVVKKKYWEIEAENIDHSISFPEATRRFRELFLDSVRIRLRSDVPVGSSLSGGIDSSSVVTAIDHIIGDSGQVQKTFSARFDDPSKDEGRYIRMLLSGIRAKPSEIWVNEEAFIQEIDSVLYHQEEPIGSASPVAQWEVMKLARDQHVTVLLDGQGADETLAGYLHFFRPYFSELYLTDRKLYRKERMDYESLRGVHFDADLPFFMESSLPGIRRFLGRLRREVSSPHYLNHLHPDFADSFKMLTPPFRTFNDLNQTLKFSASFYGLGKLLRLADRNAMAFSREVRLPFLSHHLVEFVFTLPARYKIANGWTKLILRNAFKEELPKDIAWRIEKLGYEPPQEKWMKNPRIRDGISDAVTRLKSMGILRRPVPEKEWNYLMVSYLVRQVSY